MLKTIRKVWQMDHRQVEKFELKQARKAKVTRQEFFNTEQGQRSIPVYPKVKRGGLVA